MRAREAPCPLCFSFRPHWARAAFVPEYFEGETEVTVTADSDGGLTCSYPAYEDGCTVTAAPGGTRTDTNGQLYSYLYWGHFPRKVRLFGELLRPRQRHWRLFGGSSVNYGPDPAGGKTNSSSIGFSKWRATLII